ncbi:MAG TPA: phasin family protein [Candidatus Competibacter sp.]|nr:phasin family protein [Candidatus Competibacter sp.]
MAEPTLRKIAKADQKQNMLRCSNKFAILHCSKSPIARLEEHIMVVDLFNKALESPQTLSEPLVRANKFIAATVEKMVVFQMNALKSYLDIGLNQMKAAAEIDDVKSLQDFYKRQTDIAQAVQQKFMNDAKAMSDMAARFKTEMDNLAKATLEDVLPKAA